MSPDRSASVAFQALIDAEVAARGAVMQSAAVAHLLSPDAGAEPELLRRLWAATAAVCEHYALHCFDQSLAFPAYLAKSIGMNARYLADGVVPETIDLVRAGKRGGRVAGAAEIADIRMLVTYHVAATDGVESQGGQLVRVVDHKPQARLAGWASVNERTIRDWLGKYSPVTPISDLPSDLRRKAVQAARRMREAARSRAAVATRHKLRTGG